MSKTTVPSTVITTPTETTVNQLEGIVQKRLNIKWVDAKRIIHDALHNCELSSSGGRDDNSGIPMNREDEIIEEACEIFADLSVEEQDRMRLPQRESSSSTAVSNDDGTTTESDWKRKARIQAERREAEWQIQQNLQHNQEKLHIMLKESQQTNIPEHEIPLTTIKSIRAIDNDTTTNQKNAREEAPNHEEERVPIVRVKTTTCYCIIQ